MRRQNTQRFELLFPHDLFQTLAGHPLVRGTQRNIRQLVSFLESISAAIAARDMRLAVFGAFGSKNGQNHTNLSAAGRSFCFERLEIRQNFGAIKPGSAEDFHWRREFSSRNQPAHGAFGNIAEQMGGFFKVNEPVVLGGRRIHMRHRYSLLALELFELPFVNDVLHVHALGQLSVAFEDFRGQTPFVVVDQLHQEFLLLGIDLVNLWGKSTDN